MNTRTRLGVAALASVVANIYACSNAVESGPLTNAEAQPETSATTPSAAASTPGAPASSPWNVERQSDHPRMVAPFSEASARQLNLLLRLELDSGAAIEFYEPEPGDLIVSQTGSAQEQVAPEEIRDMLPTEIFEQYMGRKAPIFLQEAEVRALMGVDRDHSKRALDASDLALLGGAEVLVPQPSDQPEPDIQYADGADEGLSEKASSFCDSLWFQQKFCDTPIPGEDWAVCVTKRSTNQSFSRGNTFQHDAATCADRGNHDVTVRKHGTFTVEQGFWRSFFYIAEYNCIITCDWVEYDFKLTTKIIGSNNSHHISISLSTD